jgi:hypothetical protein
LISNNNRAVSRAAGVVTRLAPTGCGGAAALAVFRLLALAGAFAALARGAGFLAELAFVFVFGFDAITLPLPDSPESALAI